MAKERVAARLAKIEAGVADDKVSLSSLLQSCIALGGEPGFEKLCDWASLELRGYKDATLPGYRHIPTILMAEITNLAGYNAIHQRVSPSIFPQQIREIMADKLDLEDANLSWGIGEIEALANTGSDVHRIIPGWGDFIVDTLNRFMMADNSHTSAVYWEISNSALRGVMVTVRAALAELVSDLTAAQSQDGDVPKKGVADRAIRTAIKGDQKTINYNSYFIAENATVIFLDTASGPVTIAGISGTAIGNQTASGANSSVTGSQAIRGDNNVVAGRDANAGASGQSVDKKSWWARLRERGVVVSAAIIVGTIVAILAWLGLGPGHWL